MITSEVSMRRGELAKKTNLGAETLRYYEKVGLLSPPPRTPSGYRKYPESAVARIHFIQSAKRLGFSLNQILELLQLREKKDNICSEVQERASHKLQEIEQKILELQSIKDELEELVHGCTGKNMVKDCTILNTLGREE